MSEIFSKTVTVNGSIDIFECQFISNSLHNDKMWINVLLQYSDFKIVDSVRFNNCIKIITEKFNADFISIRPKDNGLDLLFECDYDSFYYVTNGDKQ